MFFHRRTSINASVALPRSLSLGVTYSLGNKLSFTFTMSPASPPSAMICITSQDEGYECMFTVNAMGALDTCIALAISHEIILSFCLGDSGTNTSITTFANHELSGTITIDNNGNLSPGICYSKKLIDCVHDEIHDDDDHDYHEEEFHT